MIMRIFLPFFSFEGKFFGKTEGKYSLMSLPLKVARRGIERVATMNILFVYNLYRQSPDIPLAINFLRILMAFKVNFFYHHHFPHCFIPLDIQDFLPLPSMS